MKLFAVMMVKNEEINLKRCIPTIKPFVDEIIVVDTGSTDRTIEYLKANGAKVFEHPWESSFSVHRNQGIQHAKEEGADWILIVDADEELIFESSCGEIRRALDSLPDDCKVMTMPLHDIQGGKVQMKFPTPRFFAVDVVQYKNFIHNKPKFGDSKVGALEGVYINHYGYDQKLLPEKAAEKIKRRTAMLKKKREEDPDNIEILFYMNQDFSIQHDYTQSIDVGVEYVEKCRAANVPPNPNVYYTLIRAAMCLGWKKTAGELLALAMTDGGRYIDVAFITVEMGFWINRMELVETGAMRYLELYFALEQKSTPQVQNFVFTHNIDSLAYVVNSLAMVKLQQGIFQLKNLKGIFPAVGEELKTNILSVLEANLEALGLTSLLEMFTEPAPKS